MATLAILALLALLHAAVGDASCSVQLLDATTFGNGSEVFCADHAADDAAWVSAVNLTDTTFEVKPELYEAGLHSRGIRSCHDFDDLGDAFLLRVRVGGGSAVDYFRPSEEGMTACDVLKSHLNHAWLPLTTGPADGAAFVVPPRSPSFFLGCSADGYPGSDPILSFEDKRQRISAWGAYGSSYYGGCCNTDYTSESFSNVGALSLQVDVLDVRGPLNCSAAPSNASCAALNREACGAGELNFLSNVCGPCVAGHYESAGATRATACDALPCRGNRRNVFDPSGFGDAHIFCADPDGPWVNVVDLNDTSLLIVPDTFTIGMPSRGIRKCGDFDDMGDSFLIRVTMGSVVDYFRPRLPSRTLCEVLRSNSLHTWGTQLNEASVFFDPPDGGNGLLGGSRDPAPSGINFPSSDPLFGHARRHRRCQATLRNVPPRSVPPRRTRRAVAPPIWTCRSPTRRPGPPTVDSRADSPVSEPDPPGFLARARATGQAASAPFPKAPNATTSR